MMIISSMVSRTAQGAKMDHCALRRPVRSPFWLRPTQTQAYNMRGKKSIDEQQLPGDLISEMASLSSKAVSQDFLVLTEALKSRFGSSLEAVLLYGSCLRSQEIGDGLADFYVVVDS